MYNFGSNEPETAHASQTAAVNPSYIDAIIRSNEAFAKQQHDDQLLHKKGIEHELSSVSTAKVNERDLGYFGSQQQELNDLAYKAAENPQDMMAQSDFYRKANQISMEADLSRANRMVENQHKEEMLRKGLEKYYLEEQNLYNDYQTGKVRKKDADGNDIQGVYSLEDQLPHEQVNWVARLNKLGNEYRKQMGEQNIRTTERNGIKTTIGGLESNGEMGDARLNADIIGDYEIMYAAHKEYGKLKEDEQKKLLEENGGSLRGAEASALANKYKAIQKTTRNDKGEIDYGTNTNPYYFDTRVNRAVLASHKSVGKGNKDAFQAPVATTLKDGTIHIEGGSGKDLKALDNEGNLIIGTFTSADKHPDGSITMTLQKDSGDQQRKNNNAIAVVGRPEIYDASAAIRILAQSLFDNPNTANVAISAAQKGGMNQVDIDAAKALAMDAKESYEHDLRKEGYVPLDEFKETVTYKNADALMMQLEKAGMNQDEKRNFSEWFDAQVKAAHQHDEKKEYVGTKNPTEKQPTNGGGAGAQAINKIMYNGKDVTSEATAVYSKQTGKLLGWQLKDGTKIKPTK